MMVDIDVENTLREIRERVRATTLATPPPAPSNDAPAPAAATETAPHPASVATEIAAGSLSRLEANLITTERTWSRLPPLLSNRRGWVARLELWLKRLIKRATHWYTWEQVNFNASAHAALRETLAALSAYEQRLGQVQVEFARTHSEIETLRTEKEALAARLAEERAEAQQSLDDALRDLRQKLDERAAEQASTRAEIETTRAEIKATQTEINVVRAELKAETEGLRYEQRERVESVTEEQRVCFKQLSLEASETAILCDRARRRTDARLEELARRLEQIERDMKDDR